MPGFGFAGEFCAGADGVSSCHGDSGGPLICVNGNEPVLYGITSWGNKCDAPGFYVNVAHYMDWIDQTTSNPPTTTEQPTTDWPTWPWGSGEGTTSEETTTEWKTTSWPWTSWHWTTSTSTSTTNY